MDHIDLATGIVWYVVFVYSTVCHEAAHAWTSYQLGDRTAYEGGQVSLDPTPHIRREPIGMVLMPIVSFLYQGWVMGWASAPYDPRWAVIHPRRAALMAMAGPLANFALVLLSALLMYLGRQAGVFELPNLMTFTHVINGVGSSVWEGCALVLSILFTLNLILGLFNLIPLPPMDGSALPLFFLKGDTAVSYQQMMWQPAMQFIGIAVAFSGFWKMFVLVYRPILGWMAALLG